MRWRQWLRDIRCRLSGGHYSVLVVDDEGLRLRCASCGWQSPGWRVSPDFMRLLREGRIQVLPTVASTRDARTDA